MQPVGDGQWHLYDIVKDPGETQDLQQQRAADFARMRADYERYAADNGVLPMPEGYEPRHQVMINSLFNVYLPRLWLPGVALIAALGALLWRRVRRRSK